MITRRTTYRLKGRGHHARGYLTKPEAAAELEAGGVDSETIIRREAINRFGRLGGVPYLCFPLAELLAWVEKGALDRAWITVLHDDRKWSLEEFTAELARRRLAGQSVDL